jgi:hypothetical protein
MSGGLWEYQDSRLKNEIFHYRDIPHNALEDMELSTMVFELFEVLHQFDLYKSDDTSKENYLDAKKVFKKKWIRNTNYRKEVLKKIIEDEFEAKKQELIEMIDN